MNQPTLPAEKSHQQTKLSLKASLFALGSGLLLGLSAPGIGAWPLAWVALIPALWACQQEASAKTRFIWGAILGACFGGLYYLWFFDLHPLSWLGFSEIESRLITLAGWLLLVTETALVIGGLFALYGRLKSGWPRMLLFPALWVLGFALLNLTPMALPWAQVEYTQAPLWPMRILAGLVGGSGLAAIIVFHQCIWAEWFQRSPLTRKQPWQLALPLMAPLFFGLLNAWPEPSLLHTKP